MVASVVGGKDVRIYQGLCNLAVHKKVVDAPSLVVGPGISHVAPPRILYSIWMTEAESIRESFVMEEEGE